MSDTKKDMSLKSIGGQVSQDLYWQFKEACVTRHETAAQALEHAIRLYIDVNKNEREDV